MNEVKTLPFKTRLLKLKTEMKAPKSKTNNFGNYKYRSLDDITQTLKPLELEHGIIVTMSDELVLVGERYYIKSTAVALDIHSDEFAKGFGYAREPEDKKGMDQSQITGASSTYARKYAMSGLLGLDDGIDADAMDNTKEDTNKKQKNDTSKISEKNIHTIQDYIASDKKFNRTWVIDAMKELSVKDLNEMDDSKAKKLIETIRGYKELSEEGVSRGV